MSWEYFIEKKVVRKATPDTELAKSLVEMSERRLVFLQKQEIDNSSASIVASEYYEAVREICEAILAVKGFKVYSHEAITSFLLEVLKDDYSAATFDRYRKIRNGINYYGKQIAKEEAEKASSEIRLLVKSLKSKYL